MVEPPIVLATPLATQWISYLVTGPPEVGAVQETLTAVGPDRLAMTPVGGLGGAVYREEAYIHKQMILFTHVELT